MKLRPAHSLRGRLFLGLFVVTAAALLLAVGMVLRDASSPEETVDASTMTEQAGVLRQSLRFDATGRYARLDTPSAWRRAYGAPGLAVFTLYDAAGRPVARSANLKAPLARIGLPAVAGRLQVLYPGEYLALAVPAPHGHQLIVGRTLPDADTQDASPLDDMMEQLPPLAALALAALLIVQAVFEWGLRPLMRVSQEAARVGPSDPAARLSIDGVPTEVRSLVAAVNSGLDALSKAYAAERTLTAAAAHALRTPLAVLELRLQRAGPDQTPNADDLRRDVRHLTRLVNQLLSLARKEQGGAARPPGARIDIGRLTRDCIAALLPLADAAGRCIELESAGEPLVAVGHVDDLREGIINLLENALAHGQGTITVRLSRRPDPMAAVALEVSDEGQGIGEAEREAVFTRFHKVAPASPGAGLGLAIVRHVARGLGGDAAFVGPATVRLQLPAAT